MNIKLSEAAKLAITITEIGFGLGFGIKIMELVADICGQGSSYTGIIKEVLNHES